MKKNLKVLVAGMYLLSCTGLFAQDNYSKYIPEKYHQTLNETRSIKMINEEGDDDFHILPVCKYTDFIKQNRVRKGGMAFVAEQVYLLDKNSLVKNKSYINGNPEIGDVAEILSSLTNMNEIIYYSNTRRKEMLLYKDVCFVESMENPVKVDDYALRNADGLKAVFNGTDASFGVNYYAINYYQEGDVFFAFLTNIDPIGFAGLNAVQPGELIINYVIIDCGNDFIV